MTALQRQAIEDLIHRANGFRFCGPSDDPDEQSAVTIGYQHLVVQFQRLVGPHLAPASAKRLDAIRLDLNDIYSAYEAKAEIDALVVEIQMILKSAKTNDPDGGRAKQPLSSVFVDHAAGVLGDTNQGLTGPEIVRHCAAFAFEWNVTIPHARYPFEAGNKRTALAENLMAFSEPQRYRVIRALCDLPSSESRNGEATRSLKLKLFARYGHLDSTKLGEEVNEDLVIQTRHWLDPYPEVQTLFNQAIDKYKSRVLVRNLLDDLRLALEKLVQRVLRNDKSLENQLSGVGQLVKQRGGSPEFSNMFAKLVDYYCKYQNNYVKHDDAVIEEEVEFVIEMTSAFLKHFVRLAT